MKNIVVIGNSVGQYHLYNQLNEYGYGIISVVRKGDTPFSENYAHLVELNDLLHVDEYESIFATYSDIEAVCSITLEKTVLPLAIICEKHNYPGISVESATIGTNKANMIKEFEKCYVPYPKSLVTNCLSNEVIDNLNDFSFPLIIKPTDNAAKRGVLKVNSINELKFKFNDSIANSSEKKVIIQEYISGKEIIASTFIDGDKFLVNIIDKVINRNFVEVYFSAPTSLNSNLIEKINQVAFDVLKSLRITKGYAHTEMRIKDDKIYVLETSPRVSIGTIAMSKYCYGFDEVRSTINLALGERFDFSTEVKKKRVSLIHFTPEFGYILDKSKMSSIRNKNIKEIVIFKTDCQQVTEFKTNDDRIGFAIIENEINISYDEEISQVKEIEKLLFNKQIKINE